MGAIKMVSYYNNQSQFPRILVHGNKSLPPSLSLSLPLPLRSSNIGVPVHKGSPPTHLEGSPSSIGSNSSITSSTSSHSLPIPIQNPSTSYPSVKYYENHLDRSSTLIGGRADLRGEDSVTIGFNSGVHMAMATSSQMQTTILAQAEASELVSLIGSM